MVATDHRIIEMACGELLYRIPIDRKKYYINPGRDSDDDALRVNGLSNDFLRDMSRSNEIANDFLFYCARAKILIHYAHFNCYSLRKNTRDRESQHSEGGRKYHRYFGHREKYFPGQRKSLTALCLRLGLRIHVDFYMVRYDKPI